VQTVHPLPRTDPTPSTSETLSRSLRSSLCHLSPRCQLYADFLVYTGETDKQAVLFYWTFTNGFSLLQANVLRSPTVKSLLGIPIPPPVPAPPGNTGEPENPSHFDTFKKLKSTLTDRWTQATDQANMLAEQAEKQKGMRKGTLGMTERIRETSSQAKEAVEAAAPVTTAAASPTGFLEETTAKPAATSAFLEQGAEASETGSHGMSRDEVKRQRIAAARERRARQ
jgi:hypothetical protein